MKFIHMADAHLGMEPDKDSPWSRERGRELWSTFERIIELCVQEKVDLLLIAGDLFHRQPSVSDIKEMRYLFTRLGRTRVVLQAGNHDYLSSRSRYRELLQEDRIMLLPGGEVSSILIPSCNTTVYGISYTSRTESGDCLHGIHPYRTKGNHILMVHGGDAGHMPFDRGELEAAGFDYVALGHIHKPERYGSRIAYCGSPEPLDKTETGEHGVILGELTEGKCRLEFRPMAARQYRELTMQVTEETTLHSLCDQIAGQIREQEAGDMYRVRLQGFRDSEMTFDTGHLKELLPKDCRVVEVLDQSRPYFDFERLIQENPDNLMGRFLQRVQNMDRDRNWKEQVMTAGAAALLLTMEQGKTE